MHHEELEPRLSSEPYPFRTGRDVMRDEEPPSPAELAEDARIERRRPRTTTDVVTAEDFLRGHG